MRVPILSSFSELDSSPRKFLVFTLFNVVSWQCVAGSVLVLFARRVGMPPSWVGWLISFMPLSMLLVVATVPLVEHFGPRRLMRTTWLARNLIASTVFLMPWALARWGDKAAWHVLMAATLGFCLARAIGVGGWFPWLHEVVPERQRGTYFSAEMAISQMVNVAVGVVVAAVLTGASSLCAYLCIYAVGIGAGLMSLVWMSRVPGGHASPKPRAARGRFFSYRRALADRRFVRYAFQGAAGICCMIWLGASVVLYMRDQLKIPDSRVMMLTASGSLAVALTIRSWSRYADGAGCGKTMALTLMGHSLVALAYLALAPAARWTPFLIGPAVVLGGIFGSAFWATAHRGMLSLIREEGRVGYTNLWIIGTSLAMGVTPVLVGQAIEQWGLWGFRLCFAISGVIGVLCAIANLWIPEEGDLPTPHLSKLLRPSQPLRTLARIAWITAGLDESNTK